MSVDQSEHGGTETAMDQLESMPLHPKSFKLRFASQRELGRSYVSAVKPLKLPAVVRAKFYRREPEGEVEEDRAEQALSRVKDMFHRGPREKYLEPLTTSNEYGWYWDRKREFPEPLRHHIHDSAWLKERLRVLATDAGLKRR